MSYLVNKTDGTLLATVLDGQTDSNSTSLVLIGKQVSSFGELQNENFVHLLENFANSIDPVNPITGQIWWDNANNVMKVFDSANWRPVTGFTSSATAPVTNYIGDQWWDQTNDQYKIYNGTEWTTVGPAYSKLDGKSGAFVENVYDTGGTKHTIIKVYHNGNVTAIVNRDATFTPNVTITGFTTVQPGISFTNEVAAIKLYGTATNSDTLGNLTPSQFLRSDTDSTTTGSLTVEGQLTVGPAGEFNASVNGLGQVVLKNNANNVDTQLKTTINNSAVTVLAVDGTTGLITVKDAPTVSTGIATKGYTDGVVTTLRNELNGYITGNVNTLTASIASTNATLSIANDNIASLTTLKAPLASPSLTGAPTAPTPTAGDSSTKIATTAFVSNAISSFDTTKIYNGTTYMQAGATTITAVASGATVATFTTTGITTTTQSQNDNSTKVATTAYVDRADKNYVLNGTSYRPTCYVSPNTPDNNVGGNGDFWFQYQ
jgi:hypothetical protein